VKKPYLYTGLGVLFILLVIGALSLWQKRESAPEPLPHSSVLRKESGSKAGPFRRSSPSRQKGESREYTPRRAETDLSSEEKWLKEQLEKVEKIGDPEEEAKILFDLSDWYLRGALWEWTEINPEGPDLALVRKSLEALDRVIQRHPGTEHAAAARLRRARVFHNGLSGIWDREHLRESRRELVLLLEKHPGSQAAREGRELLAEVEREMAER